MPRRRMAIRRSVVPDPIYNDIKLAKFINNVMLKGKKSLARSICYDALEIIRERTDKNPLDVFRQALANVRPVLEVKPRRVGGATYQVPVEVRGERQEALAMRWIITHSRKRGEKTMPQRLANELMEAARGEGASVKKREDTHRMAEANKAFAHYRW